MALELPFWELGSFFLNYGHTQLFLCINLLRLSKWTYLSYDFDEEFGQDMRLPEPMEEEEVHEEVHQEQEENQANLSEERNINEEEEEEEEVGKTVENTSDISLNRKRSKKDELTTIYEGTNNNEANNNNTNSTEINSNNTNNTEINSNNTNSTEINSNNTNSTEINSNESNNNAVDEGEDDPFFDFDWDIFKPIDYIQLSFAEFSTYSHINDILIINNSTRFNQIIQKSYHRSF